MCDVIWRAHRTTASATMRVTGTLVASVPLLLNQFIPTQQIEAVPATHLKSLSRYCCADYEYAVCYYDCSSRGVPVLVVRHVQVLSPGWQQCEYNDNGNESCPRMQACPSYMRIQVRAIDVLVFHRFCSLWSCNIPGVMQSRFPGA